MHFAYCDPPYIGMAHKYAENQEVDHAELIERLCAEFPDGWALSLSSPTLRVILPLCPEDCRVMAWVKPFASFKPGVNPAYAWEPVIVRGGRKRERTAVTVTDCLSCPIALKRGLFGAKPEGFCYWLFAVLGAESGDELSDLYPGTGVVGRCWATFTAQQQLNRYHPVVRSAPLPLEGLDIEARSEG